MLHYQMRVDKNKKCLFSSRSDNFFIMKRILT
jgi:hypothetical protein